MFETTEDSAQSTSHSLIRNTCASFRTTATVYWFSFLSFFSQLFQYQITHKIYTHVDKWSRCLKFQGYKFLLFFVWVFGCCFAWVLLIRDESAKKFCPHIRLRLVYLRFGNMCVRIYMCLCGLGRVFSCSYVYYIYIFYVYVGYGKWWLLTVGQSPFSNAIHIITQHSRGNNERSQRKLRKFCVLYKWTMAM